jgi:hypothetical protein
LRRSEESPYLRWVISKTASVGFPGAGTNILGIFAPPPAMLPAGSRWSGSAQDDSAEIELRIHSPPGATPGVRFSLRLLRLCRGGILRPASWPGESGSSAGSAAALQGVPRVARSALDRLSPRPQHRLDSPSFRNIATDVERNSFSGRDSGADRNLGAVVTRHYDRLI